MVVNSAIQNRIGTGGSNATGAVGSADFRGTVPMGGVDFCHELLARAVAKTRRKKGGARIRYIEADAQQLPFADNQFQIVCVAFGLRNVTDTDRGLREMVRVAKSGGRVAV